MSNGIFRLLEKFRLTFAGQVYRHRNSTLGNKIGRELFEDLLSHNVSGRYTAHVQQGAAIINASGKIQTPREIRRNDSVLGKPPAGATLLSPKEGFRVPEGSGRRIGCEVKIIAKAHLKQVDRVISDLTNFVNRMKRLNKKCINVAIVGINYERDYVGHERDRTYQHRLRDREAETTQRKLVDALRDTYDDFIILPFKASNRPPYPFNWLNAREVDADYGSVLTRIGETYSSRFR